MMTAPAPGQILRTFGGPVDVRVEIDTGLDGSTFGLWDAATWDESIWGSEEPSWNDITPYVLGVSIDRGASRWGERFQTGTATITLDNTTGVFTPDSNVPSPWYLPFRPGRRIRVVAVPDPDDPLDKHPLFYGEIDASFDAFDSAAFDLYVTLPCTDFMGSWSDHNPPALLTPTGVEDTDERVISALDRMSWPAGLRDIDTGLHTMQSSFLAQSTLEECQTAADAEGGAFFCSRDGKATFKNRDWLITDTRAVNIQGYIGYEEVPTDANSAQVLDVQTSWEIARVTNQVQFARIGSTMQEVEDSGSQAINGVRSYPRTDFQNNADSEVLFLAERYLTVNKDARIRLDQVSIAANADPDNEDLNRLFWDADFGDLLQVKVQTAHGWSIERVVNVMGIHDEITADDWVRTFRLDDAQINFLAGRDLLMALLEPIAWWRFEESGGTTTADETGNGHGLTWSGGAILSPTGSPIADGFGIATLDGVNDTAIVANEADLELRQDMSIEMWVRFHDLVDGADIIDCSGSTYLYALSVHQDTFNFLKMWPGTSDAALPIVLSPDPIPENEWTHVVVTIQWTATTRVVTSYLNGQLAVSHSPLNYLPPVEARSIAIGLGTLDGDLSETSFFDYVLTPAQVLDLYNSNYS